MKKIIYSLLSATLLFSACEDRLNIEQKGVIPFESFYQTDDDAQNALNNLYQSFCLNIAGNEGIYIALPVLFNEPGDDMLAAGNYYGDNDFGAQLNEFQIGSHSFPFSVGFSWCIHRNKNHFRFVHCFFNIG